VTAAAHSVATAVLAALAAGWVETASSVESTSAVLAGSASGTGAALAVGHRVLAHPALANSALANRVPVYWAPVHWVHWVYWVHYWAHSMVVQLPASTRMKAAPLDAVAEWGLLRQTAHLRRAR